MQPVWLYPHRQAIWGHILKSTVEKSQTNATSVTLHALIEVLYGDISKHTVEKNWTNAISVTLCLVGRITWGHTWKSTQEENRTNAANVTMHPHTHIIWERIWKRTVEKSQSNVTTVTLHLQCDSASSHVSNVGTHLKIHTGDKSNSVTSHLNIWKCTVEKIQMQPRIGKGGGV